MDTDNIERNATSPATGRDALNISTTSKVNKYTNRGQTSTRDIHASYREVEKDPDIYVNFSK
jgi:hypothetical protein